MVGVDGLAGLEGGDFGHVDHVVDAQPVGPDPEAAGGVDREVPEGMGAAPAAPATSRTAARAARTAPRRATGLIGRSSGLGRAGGAARPGPARRLVAHGQVGGDRERLGQVAAGGGGHAQVGLDGGQVVPEQRVAGAEPDRGLGVGEGLAGPSRLAQGPAQGVLGVDGRPVGQGAPGHGDDPPPVGARVTGMVGLEPGQLQVDGHPVGLVEPLDHPDQPVPGAAAARSPRAARTSPSKATVAGRGRRVAAGSRAGRPGQVPAGGCDPGHADLGQP